MIEEIKIDNMERISKYRHQLYQKPILKNLFLEVTSRCNARCEHCGSRCGEKYIEDGVSTEEFKQVLKDVAEKYNAKEILISVTGGEPLLRKDLFDIMQYAIDLGFYWGITTNGMLINDDIIEKMVKTKMTSISISIDGLKETHENFRKVPNSFDKIIENIKKLQKIPTIECVQVTTVVNKKNFHELEDMYQLMLDIGVKNWRVINCDPIGRAKDNNDILLDKEQYIKLFDFIKEKREENKICVEYGCSHYLGLTYEKELRDIYFLCMAGIYIASILSNGDIFVCPNVERRKELIQGNIKVDKFTEVWENKFQFYRNENRTSCDTCKKCKNWNYCAGDSLHTWNFDLQKPSFCINEIIKEEK